MKKRNIVPYLAIIYSLFTGCPSLNNSSDSFPGIVTQPRFIGNGLYEGDYWPAEAWKFCDPEAVGIDSEKLIDVYEESFQSELETGGLVIIKDGYIVAEHYSNATSQSFFDGNKMAWIFTSAAIGKAIEFGFIESIDNTVCQYFDEWDCSDVMDPRRSITIEHLLTMTSGLKWDESQDLDSMNQSSSHLSYVLEKETVSEPGTVFNLSSGDAALLSEIIRQSTGMQLHDFIQQNVFEPIGIIKPQWDTDQSGLTKAYSGISARLQDYARFGLLFLSRGQWQGEQVVSGEWVDASAFMSRGVNPQFGYLWHNNLNSRFSMPDTAFLENAFMAAGENGQRLYVIPSENIVIVRAAGVESSSQWNDEQFLQRIFESLIGDIERTLVFACSEDNDLFQAVTQSDRPYPRYDSAAEAISYAPDYSGVLILADRYPDTTEVLEQECITEASIKRLRLYVEYPSSLPGLDLGRPRFQRVTTGSGNIDQRIVVNSNFFNPSLEKNRILMVNSCYYLPVFIADPHLALSQVVGYDSAVLGITEGYESLLFKHPDAQILVATTKLSHFVTGRYAPAVAWAKVWERILGWLVPGTVLPPLTWEPEVRPSYSSGEVLPENAMTNSIMRALEYYYQSHLLIHPDWPQVLWPPGCNRILPDWPVGDGSYGIGEAYITHRIYADGSQAVSRGVRADCNLEAGMGLSAGAVVFNDEKYQDTAIKINDYMLFESILSQGPRANRYSPSYGLLGWMEGSTSGLYFGDDSARALLATIASAAFLQTDQWDEAIVRTILGNFRTTGIFGYRPALIYDEQLQQKGWKYYNKLSYIDYCPHYQSWLWCTYLWLYDKTGYSPLLDKVKSGMRMMMEAFPEQWRFEANRYESELCRMLLPLAWLVRVEDTAEHRQWLDRIARAVIDIQEESGAIRQIPVMVLTDNALYGTSECALVYEEGDPATDALYSINFALIGMHEAAYVTGESEYSDSARRLADFFIRTQTRSESHPELDGTWFRGFDLEKWDYWGSDGDLGWGVWVNEIGWTHSWITTALTLMEMDASLWDLSRGSQAGVHFDFYKGIMLP